ncbi:putative ribonuclease H-like domain-containing protein [Tanacetum coccineum]|uniref:Ribonuclease H-like domain-containing protein n=1 Tax=Tanacetum coccineum TaxID=301880 RepID=A0ABQ5I2B3_9ASTR
MNYHPVSSENQANLHAGQQEANQNAGTEDIIDAGDSEKEDESAQDCFVLPIWPSYSSTITLALTTDDKREGPREEEQVFLEELERLKRQENEANKEAEALRKKFEQETENLVIQEGAAKPSSTNIFSTVSTPRLKPSSTNLVNTVSLPVSTASPHEGLSLSDPTNPEEDDSEIPPLEDIYQNSTDGIFTTSSYDDEGAVADFTNLEIVMNVSPIPRSRIHSSHPLALILGDPNSAVQRSKVNTSSGAHAFVSYVQKQKRTNHKDFHHCYFALFPVLMSQHEAKKISEALEVYQMDVKSAFLYGKIDEEVYVSQPPGFLDPKYPQKVYKVVKALYGLHQAPRAWYATLSTFLLKNGYKRGTIDKTLFLKKDKHDIILVQVYVDDIIFGSTKKSWCDEFEALMKSRFQIVKGRAHFLSWMCKSNTNQMISFISQDEVLIIMVCKSVLVLEFLHFETWNPTLICDYAGANLTGNPHKASKLQWAQFLWIQIKCLDYGSNFMNTKIYIDKESTICIVKNPDLLTKAFLMISQFSVLVVYYWGDKSIKLHWLKGAYVVGLIEFRESLRRVIDGTEALQLPTLFILWLDKVSTAGQSLLNLYKPISIAQFLTHSLSNIHSHLQALISLLTTISLSSKMVVLDSCPKHNMVAYLEKSEGNAEFHEIIDFLKRSSIHHALTVSPVVSTTFVEQFWTSAKSKTINNVRHITAKVAGKSVSISEASIRSDLLFDDADGIDSLPNQAIFDAIQLMGHLDAKKKFVMYPRFISIFLDKQLANVPVPLDHFPVNALTSKVFSFMVKKGKHFSGKVTPLFASMLVQPTEDEGAPSERPSEAQPTPSPAHTSEVPFEPQTDSSPAHTSEVPFEPQTDSSPAHISEVPIEQQNDPSPRPSPSISSDSIQKFWWEILVSFFSD